ncbi:MAG: hypothetical protein Kow00114_16640 [Kiloniellaceae bacterium]
MTFRTTAALLALLAPALFGTPALFATPAWAEAPPAANSQIQAVYDDLDRFEAQAAGASRNSANRILKLLGLTEGRLQGAPDQGDPSWQAAAERLATLKQQLENIAAGKPAAAAAQPAVESAPALEAAPVIASGNPVVSQAAADIQRLSGLVDAMAPGDKTAGQQYLNQLSEIGNALRGVADKDQAWADTAKAFNELQSRVVDVANAAPAAAPAGAAPASQTAAADPNVEAALRELGFNDRNLQQMRGASVKMEQRILADLARLRETLDAVPDKSQARWLEADGEWQRQMDLLAQLRLESIEKQLVSIGEQADALDSSALTNEGTVANFQGAFDKAAAEMQVYAAYASKPGYAGTWDTHTRVATRFQERVAAAQAAESQFGDVKANVAAIEQSFKDTPIPRALQEFPSKEVVIAYAEEIKKAYAASTQAAAYMEQIDGKTSQVDKQTVQRIKRYAGVDRIRQIDESLKLTRAYLDGHWVVYQGVLDFRATDDPTDANHRANRFLMPGRYEENMAKLQEGLDFVAILDAYESSLGTEDKSALLQRQAALQNAVAQYEANFQLALSAQRIAPGIGDSELEAIAEETLKNPRYGANLPLARLEVGKKAHRKEARSEVSGNSIVTNIYEWDEFQARTVEQVDGKWYIFVNDLKYFYSGASTTPLDRWLVADRWQSSQILEENIDK